MDTAMPTRHTHGSRSTKNTLRACALAAAMVGSAGAIVATPSTAQAEEVSPTGKGIVGTALLGGELVVFTEAIFGVRSTTAYLVGAGAGMVAGGVGGYFIEQAVSDGRIPAYLLAGGLALLIPAIVVTLDATRYLPAEGAREDKPVQNLPPSDPGKPGGSSVVGAEAPATPPPATTPPAGGGTAPATPPTTPQTPPAGGGGTKSPERAPQASLFHLNEGSLRIGLPVPEIRPVLGANERVKMGVDNKGSEVRFPVVRVTF
jgi:hypothetical protein